MSKRLYANQILLDKRFFNLLDMDSFFKKTLGKYVSNIKNLNQMNCNELNETFY